jgi:hypothetical protein
MSFSEKDHSMAERYSTRKPWFASLIGQTFGRLTVISHEGMRTKSYHQYWKCRCSCQSGIEVIVQDCMLKNGNTRSCGCLKREQHAGSEGRLVEQIPGEVRSLIQYPGYVFSSTGDAWSCWNEANPAQMTRLYYRLVPRVDTNKHFTVKLFKKTHWLHRLILEAFQGPCPEGLQCLHGDGDPTNNEPSNLRWGTRSENMLDRTRHGKFVPTRGTDVWCSRITEDDAKAIYALRKQGISSQAIANQFGVSRSTVSYIGLGRTWRHVTGAEVKKR